MKFAEIYTMNDIMHNNQYWSPIEHNRVTSMKWQLLLTTQILLLVTWEKQ